MNNKEKYYLIIAGTFLPAFIGVTVLSTIRKEQYLDRNSILVFSGLSIVGAYITSKIIKDI